MQLMIKTNYYKNINAVDDEQIIVMNINAVDDKQIIVKNITAVDNKNKLL